MVFASIVCTSILLTICTHLNCRPFLPLSIVIFYCKHKLHLILVQIMFCKSCHREAESPPETTFKNTSSKGVRPTCVMGGGRAMSGSNNIKKECLAMNVKPWPVNYLLCSRPQRVHIHLSTQPRKAPGMDFHGIGSSEKRQLSGKAQVRYLRLS